MLKIFIVDDNPIFAQTLEHIVSSAHPTAEIKVFDDGDKLINQIGPVPPHLIFMDINLPNTDGLALTRQIREKNNVITIIVITSYDDPEYAAAAIDAGADGFISKRKITLDEVLKLTDSIVDHTKF